MPIAKLDKQQVLGALKGTHSSDPDVLYARKEELLSETRKMKLLGIVPIIVGAIMTISLVGAIVGIPALIFGLWARKRIKHNITTADQAYEEYVAGLGVTNQRATGTASAAAQGGRQ